MRFDKVQKYLSTGGGGLMGYTRAGMGDGACQIPQPGVAMIFPPCPASSPIGSGIPAASYTSGGGGAAYVAPATVPVPSCSLDTRPGGAAFSDACISQVLAAQQQNMQLANNANYQVDLANCLNTFPQPTDCYQRTFGLTPTGGYTSDAGAGPGGSQLILGPGGPVASPPPVATPAAVPNPYVAAAPILPPKAAAPPGGTPVPTRSFPNEGQPLMPDNLTGGYVSSATDFLTGDTSVAGFTIPMWGWLAAGAAALYLLAGKH